MEKTKVTLIAILFLVCLSSKSFAQFNLGCSFGASVPTSTFFSEYFKTGIGGSVNGEYFKNKRLSFGANISYYYFNGNDSAKNVFYDNLGNSYSILSMHRTLITSMANCKYYFNKEGFNPFVGLSIGYNLLTIYENFDNSNVIQNTSFFAISPSVGFITGDKIKWFANLNYNYNIGQGSVIITYVNLNVGVLFHLGFIK